MSTDEAFAELDEGSVAIKYYRSTAGLPPPSVAAVSAVSGGSRSPRAAAAGGGRAPPPCALAELERRVARLERALHGCPTPSHAVDEPMRRARTAVESAGCYSCAWRWVPPGYYDMDLERRREILGARTTYQLCKSMLMENRACDGADRSDRTNSRFYLVVVQYEASIGARRLESEVRALRPPGPTRLDPSRFDFRVADPVDNDRLTGYGTGAVAPFGLRDGTVPVLLAKDITKLEPRFMWMGGGHVDLKLGMAVDEFIKGTRAIVADVSEPRSGGVDE